ncbi:MAG: acyl carrier protein [Candidatus Brocadia sp.]|nr:acyl carrier protein [Candidatus Brocadia sp.]
MSVFATEAIEKTLVAIVEDLIQDWGLDIDATITGHTMLVADLEFASVDIIQLCVAIEQHYQQKMGFQSLLMKDGSYVSDLSISQIAGFLVAKINNEDK